MRRFVVVGHKASTAPFSLDDLPGAGGRMDLLVRCVTAAFLLSHGLRREVEVSLVLQGPPRSPRTVRWEGRELKMLNPDERSTAALLSKALSVDSGGEVETSPGIFVSSRSFSEVLGSVAGRPVWLREEGEDLRTATIPANATFVLSDHQDFSEAEKEILEGRKAWPVSVGPLSLHADQCIAIVHNELDRREAGKAAEP